MAGQRRLRAKPRTLIPAARCPPNGPGEGVLVSEHERREDPKLHRLDLQRQILGVDAALRQAAGDEPQAFLWRTLVHVAELAVRADAPDWADALDHCLAERTTDQFHLRIVAGRENDEIGRNRRSVLQQRAIGG